MLFVSFETVSDTTQFLVLKTLLVKQKFT